MPAVLSVPVATTALSTATSGMQQAFATTTRREVTSSAVLSNLLHYLRTNRPMTASTLAVAAIFVYALKDRPATADDIEKRLNREEQRSDEDSKRAARVDRTFLRRLTHLLAIAIPSPLSRESGYLSVLALVLAIRTYLSIRITSVNGEIVKAIVQRNFVAFLSRLAMLASIAIPASIVNSLLKYLRGQIALCLRSRLVHYFHQRYLSSHMFYSVLQLDSRIAHPDQALTETLDKWSVSCAQLYSDITKPTLDIVLFAWKISDVIGPLGPLAVVTYYFLCGLIIQTISPRFGRMTAQTQRLEGAFRTAHHRLITSSEEVAFYGGQQREQSIINNKFNDVLVNQSEFFRKQLSMGVLDSFLTKVHTTAHTFPHTPPAPRHVSYLNSDFLPVLRVCWNISTAPCCSATACWDCPCSALPRRSTRRRWARTQHRSHATMYATVDCSSTSHKPSAVSSPATRSCRSSPATPHSSPNSKTCWATSSKAATSAPCWTAAGRRGTRRVQVW